MKTRNSISTICFALAMLTPSVAVAGELSSATAQIKSFSYGDGTPAFSLLPAKPNASADGIIKIEGVVSTQQITITLGSGGAVLYHADDHIIVRQKSPEFATFYPNSESRGIAVIVDDDRESPAVLAAQAEDLDSIEDWSRVYAYRGAAAILAGKIKPTKAEAVTATSGR